MLKSKLTRTVVLAAMALSFAAAASAQTTTPAPAAPAQPTSPTIFFGICPGFDDARERADAAIVEAALTGYNNGGYDELRRRLPALRDVLARAPSCYPQLERRDSSVILRSSDDRDIARLQPIVAAAAQAQGLSSRIDVRDNAYAVASLLLGVYAVEFRQYADAVQVLERGLALQPLDHHLATEMIAALQGAGRHPDAYAIIRRLLDSPEAAPTLDRSRFLRMAGVTLIDLNRLDEAEAALQDSIRLEPNNPIAHNELQYIAELRAGGQRRDVVIESNQK